MELCRKSWSVMNRMELLRGLAIGSNRIRCLVNNYITALHNAGKSPATIAQAGTAVKWQLKHQAQDTLNFPITQATLSGIRRKGKDRGRG